MLDLAIDNRIFINDEFSAALQELDIIFNTEYTEMLGDTTFGIYLEQYMWTLTPMEGELTHYINEKILQTTYASNLVQNVQVSFQQGEYRAVYVISISILQPSTGDVYMKKYQFQ